MKRNHQFKQNQFEIKDNIVHMTIENKKGKEFIATFDKEYIDKVQKTGTWFAQWDKDFNAYLVLCSTQIKNGSAIKYIKRTLQSVILDTSTNAPIRHLDGDLFNNCKENLEIYNRKQKNEIEYLENDVIAIFLKNRYGTIEGKALIDLNDLPSTVTDEFTWILQKHSNGQPYAISHTENGRIYLDQFLANPSTEQRVNHINKNPLDNRRVNLELQTIETNEDLNSLESTHN